MAVISKQFTTHKRGESDSDIQDSINVDIEQGKYALSDGVSQSFLPRMLADILTEAYVNASADGTPFPPADLPQQFAARKEAFLASLDEFGRTIQEITEETFKVSAATFVGLVIGEKEVSWKVIGDSCLFILPDDGEIRCVSSDQATMDEEGVLHIQFGYTPAQIHSDGKLCGNIVIDGTAPREAGWYVLMSDAISEWFVARWNNHEDVLGRLFALKDNAEFEELVEQEWQAQRIKSDDCSVVIIRVDIDPKETLPAPEPAPEPVPEPEPEYIEDAAPCRNEEPEPEPAPEPEPEPEPVPVPEPEPQTCWIGRAWRILCAISSKLFIRR